MGETVYVRVMDGTDRSSIAWADAKRFLSKHDRKRRNQAMQELEAGRVWVCGRYAFCTDWNTLMTYEAP